MNYPKGLEPVSGLTNRISMTIPVMAIGNTQIDINLIPKNFILLLPVNASFVIVYTVIFLCLIGYVMITSASIDVSALRYKDPFYQMVLHFLELIYGLSKLYLNFSYDLLTELRL